MKNQIQFAHSNGFPAQCFNSLFNMIENAEINYIERMGHNKFLLNSNLENLAHELITSIEQRFNKPITGIGHSTGGVLMLIAASKKPQLFKNIIVIEPILYHPRKRKIIEIMKRVGLSGYIGPAKSTLKRKSFFKSREEAKAYFKSKTLFKTFHENCLIDYIKYGLKKTEKGFELSFSKEIESEIYRSTYTKVPLGIEKLKGTLIYGKKSNMFSKTDVRWWKKSFPNFDVITLDTGHLFPLENPSLAAKIINKILKKVV
ncbi:alpha/beta hydrolase-fold protein [Tenacibaculum sp. ZS6-P6]|uniref:alpha/beta hydrolase-fold protein n=1 Tax=Tenacibaculum sp. ZS6-P6 TaxID=3447503 RepID=UPI003F9D348E